MDAGGSRKDEGYEEYLIKFAQDQDAFLRPSGRRAPSMSCWKSPSSGANIDTDTIPALLRLIGAKQDLD